MTTGDAFSSIKDRYSLGSKFEALENSEDICSGIENK